MSWEFRICTKLAYLTGKRLYVALQTKTKYQTNQSYKRNNEIDLTGKVAQEPKWPIRPELSPVSVA